jgi:hypothetical protein
VQQQRSAHPYQVRHDIGELGLARGERFLHELDRGAGRYEGCRPTQAPRGEGAVSAPGSLHGRQEQAQPVAK